MKKLLIVLLALSLIFAFAACGQQEAPVEEEPAAEEALEFVGSLDRNGISEEEQSAIRGENMRYYDDLNSLLLALDKGDIIYMDADQPLADYISAANPGAYEVKEDDGETQYALALPAENTQLLETLNNALAALQADGTLDALKAEYLENVDPANMPTPTELPRFDGGQTLRIVVTGDMPPMDYMTPDGQAAGYNIALLTAIANQTQINFELVSANSASRALMVAGGKADLIFWSRYHAGSDGAVNSIDLAEGLTATEPYLTVPCKDIYKAQ